jgi:CDGSH-type Zn-finger protein
MVGMSVEPAEAEQPAIEVRPNGPYLVKGGPPLRRKRPIVSEHGEPLTWSSDAAEPVVDRGPVYALCRCGGSASKPFCDGTHARAGFDGTESAPTDTYADGAKEYIGTGITVTDDRGICEHAGFCGNRLTNVWKMVRATEDSIVRAQVIAMIERCPSGALTFTVDGRPIEPDLPVEIGVVDDGPLFVTGGIPVRRSDGQPFETRNRVTLCRCGGSKNKPLCDGTHREIGFHST